jgi:hypothetical protein
VRIAHVRPILRENTYARFVTFPRYFVAGTRVDCIGFG